MKTRKFVLLAIIAAVYTGVSLLLAPFSFGNIQVRVAEALTLLPVLMFESVWALALGCFLTNLLGVMSGVNTLGIMDVVLGSLTTLLAGIMSAKLGKYHFKGYPVLACLPPIFLNALIIGWELAYVLSPSGTFSWQLYGLMFIEIMCGQALAIFGLGLPLIKRMAGSKLFLNDTENEHQ